MNQPRRRRLIAIPLLAILVAALVSVPAFSIASPSKTEKFIEIAKQAKAIADQLRAFAQSRGIDTPQVGALIEQGQTLLNEAIAANSSGNSELAVSKAREAQVTLRDAIALLSAPSFVTEGAEEAKGLLVAAQRARVRIAELRLALATYQSQVSVDQQSAQNIAWVNANLTSAEGSLTQVENALGASSPNVSSAAQSLAQAQKTIRLAFAAMSRIEFQPNAWRIPGFITAMERLIEKIDSQLKVEAGRGVNVQDLQAKIVNIREHVKSAKGKAANGDIQDALALIKEARGLLLSIEKALEARRR